MKTKTIEDIREDFPLLSRKINGKPLVFLDSAASSQKPSLVIEAIDHYYSYTHANVHRGVYQLSQEATDAFELGRKKVASFIHAEHLHEVIFTKGTTDAINLVAFSFSQKFLKPGDRIMITGMEHHANIVPWQMACARTGAELIWIPYSEEGDLDMDWFEKHLDSRVKLVSVVHVSNALGTVNPVKKIIEKAHQFEIPVLVDGAQSITHLDINVRELGADFFVFSGHKLFGPTGIGVLYGKEKWLNALPPYQGGGEMIKTVTLEKSTWADLPHKFEAGTPHISGAVGMGAGLDYLNGLEKNMIQDHERDLLEYGTGLLKEIQGVRIVGEAKEKVGVISFLLGAHHPYDVGVILDQLGIAVRTGHHCTQPIMDRYGIPGTVRASVAFYNTREDMDRLAEGVRKALKMLG